MGRVSVKLRSSLWQPSLQGWRVTGVTTEDGAYTEAESASCAAALSSRNIALGAYLVVMQALPPESPNLQLEDLVKGEWHRKSDGRLAVVFVHGVLSDGDACWRNDKHNTYWPDLLANEPQVEQAGIYIFSYKTGVFSGTYRLSDVVDDLKERMLLDKVFDIHEIVFVAHSMGGIVVRKLLVERASDFLERKTSIGLFLLASPTLGSGYADLFKALARALQHRQAEALALSHDNAWLADLDKEFSNLFLSGKLRLKGKELVEDVFFRKVRWLFLPQVVPAISGAKYFAESYKVPNSDHFSIAKPGSKDAIQHRQLVQFIVDFTAPPHQWPPLAETQAHIDAAQRYSGGHDQAAEQAVRQQSSATGAERDRWYSDLCDGALILQIRPAASREIDTLTRMVSNVLAQKKFSSSAARSAEVVIRELLANALLHACANEARVVIEIATTHLPAVIISVANEGSGFDISSIIERQLVEMKDGEREHGLGRVCRLADDVTYDERSEGRVTVECTLYDVPKPTCLCDEFDWCGRILLDYSSPASVWFGERRYSLWWSVVVGGARIGSHASSALNVLNLSIDQAIPQVIDVYLHDVLAPRYPYLFLEIRGHGSTETGDPRTSADTVLTAAVTGFRSHFQERKVILYASENAYTGELQRISEEYAIPLISSEKKCRALLSSIDQRAS
jgi:anti-sigma regulatory factor (Ser/Thr protein kinase)/pimeloyl-ACP methyl ester carboxylesterase